MGWGAEHFLVTWYAGQATKYGSLGSGRASRSWLLSVSSSNSNFVHKSLDYMVYLHSRVVLCPLLKTLMLHRNNRSQVQIPTVECIPGQVVNTHVPLSPSSTIWYQPCGWEGNRRSGIALATCHRHQWFSTYGLKALEREMSTCLCSLVEHGRVYYTLYVSTLLGQYY